MITIEGRMRELLRKGYSITIVSAPSGEEVIELVRFTGWGIETVLQRRLSIGLARAVENFIVYVETSEEISI